MQIALIVLTLLLAQHILAANRKKRQGVIRVFNNSDFTIYYKPENGEIPTPILPKSGSIEELDGLATHKHKNKVYKVTRGILAHVNPAGEVLPNYTYASLLEKTYFLIFGGWLSKPPDKGWQLLFDTAKTIK